MSDYEDVVEEDIGGSLVDQLGSPARYLARGVPDFEIVSIIRGSEDNPDLFFPSVWMNAVNHISQTGGTFLNAWAIATQKASIAVRGGGRSGIIKAEQVKKHGMVQYEAEVAEPSRLDKILNNEKAQRYEQAERERLEI